MTSQTSSVLGKTFSNLLDESELDQMVRSQLIDIQLRSEDDETPKSPEEGPVQEEIAPSVAEQDSETENETDQSIDDDIQEAEEALLEDLPVTGGMLKIDDVELLDAFIQETSEHLDSIEEKILKLEKGADPDLVDEIFRSMHTIKGSSSFLGFVSLELVSHRCESLLDGVRSDRLSVSSELVDILLSSSDVLKRLIEGVVSESTEKRKCEGVFEICEGRIDINPHLKKISGINLTEKPSPELAPEPIVEADSDDDFDYQSLVTSEMVASYISESMELLSDAERAVLDLEDNPENDDLLASIFRAIHTIKGNAGFLGYARHEQVCSDLEDSLSSLRDGEKTVSQRVVTTLLRVIDSLGKLIAETEKDQATADDSEVDLPIGELLKQMGEVSEDDVDQALRAQQRTVGEILVEEGKVSREAVEHALEKQKPSANEQRYIEASTYERKDIRVDVTKLDRLFELMGELITAEAIVITNPDLEGMELDNFHQASNYLSKITRQMQEITMSVRMIPLEGLFNKTRRAVRDLSKRYSKEIEIVTQGQETEMDRNVIEELSDPMTHIIRNAIDHGIEEKEIRIASGKPEKGQIFLGARHEGSEIWITVRDDGRGLDRQRIQRKAVEKGLIRADEAESLDDSQIWRLLLEPGFSTAEKVSEISGRGVGMDVVKQNIEKLRGKLDISTTPGAETEFILKIPLSLSIIDGITIRVGNVHYAIPLSDVREFQRAQPDYFMKTSSNIEVLKLRDEILPILRLSDFFHAESTNAAEQEGVFLIVQNGTRHTALLVDEIIGYHQIVMKALPEYIGRMNGISGCSIMANGDVTFIINTSDLIVDEV